MKRWALSSGVVCCVALGLVACDDQGPTPEPTSGFELEVAALNLAALGSVTYTITVDDATNAPLSYVVNSATYGVGGPALVRYVAPCDAFATGHTVAVEVDEIVIGGVTLPASALPPPQTKSATCTADQSTQVAFEFHSMGSSGQGFFDIAVATDVFYCSAKLDCTDNTGGTSAFFPSTSKAGLVLGFACSASADADANTVLHLDHIVITCGGAGTATIDADTAGNLASGKITGASTLIDGVTVFRGEEITGGVDNVYWNVSIGLTASAVAATCTLTAQGTATDGTTVGIDVPFVDWDVALTSNGVDCTTHPIFGTTTHAGVNVDWPSAGTAETFDNRYTGHPVAFLTATTYTPGTTYHVTSSPNTFATLADADSICMASKGTLPGTFKAWLSDAATDAKSRFSTEAVRLASGTLVALGQPDLLDGTLAVAINQGSGGATLTGDVWTGTKPDGTKDTDTCTGWTLATGDGTFGTQSTTSTWTDAGAQSCATPSRLLCIQVP